MTLADDLDGTMLFRTLARGVLALSECADSSSLSLPYPADTQLALDRVVLACAHQGIVPPMGVPELITWCAELTADRWPFPLAEFVAPETRLVDPCARTRTRSCVEIATDAAAESEETAIAMMAEVVGDSAPGAAARKRAFLIRTVVIDRSDHQSLFRAAPDSALMFKQVKHLYGPAPSTYVVDDQLWLCPTCGLLALPSNGGTVWCEGETCPRDLPVTAMYFAADSQVLVPALRLFLALPGCTESRLLKRFASLSLSIAPVDLVLGRYRVTPTHGGPQVIRVYDRIQPALLAQRVLRDSVSLAVLPRRLLAGQPAFLRKFFESIPEDSGIELISDHDLVSLASGYPATTRDA